MAITGFDFDKEAPERLDHTVLGTTSAAEDALQLAVVTLIDLPAAAFRALFGL